MSYPIAFVDSVTRFLARLNIQPRSPLLFQQALTHRSYLNEHPEIVNLPDNERLEFLATLCYPFWRRAGSMRGCLKRAKAS
jgi:ribonuclease-3